MLQRVWVSHLVHPHVIKSCLPLTSHTRLNVPSSSPSLMERAWNEAIDSLISTSCKIKYLGHHCNYCFFCQRTPLHMAARRDHEDIVKYLVDKGAGINIQDNDGVSI